MEGASEFVTIFFCKMAIYRLNAFAQSTYHSSPCTNSCTRLSLSSNKFPSISLMGVVGCFPQLFREPGIYCFKGLFYKGVDPPAILDIFVTTIAIFFVFQLKVRKIATKLCAKFYFAIFFVIQLESFKVKFCTQFCREFTHFQV